MPSKISSKITLEMMDTKKFTEAKPDSKSKMDEKQEYSRTKITPFSIADILTKGSSVEETRAIDMSNKRALYESRGM